MERSVATQAIVVRRERWGEFNKNLVLLTADNGLLRATAYGACKMHSSLRLGSEPFTWSLARLYHNPVKHTWKVMELEINDSFAALQQDLGRLSAASLWAEVVDKSYGAGEVTGALFPLFLDCLRLLCAPGSREPYVTIQFLWRFLGLAGWQPDTGSCERCGTSLAGVAAAVYAPSTNALLCRACGADRSITIPAGCLRYLDATSSLPMEAALAISMEAASLAALRTSLPLMLQAVLEGELASLRLAGGVR
jgi:DNA repair protein RecO (recombination protein O)